MNEKRFKKVFNILIIFFLFIFLCIGSISNNEINVNNNNVINEMDIFNYILEIDDILLDIGTDEKELSKENMINFAVQYILNNYDKYASKIYNINDEFYYEEECTKYFSQGYVNIELIDEIINNFFGKQNIDLKSHAYYNKEIDKFALVSKTGDHIFFNEVNLLDVIYNDNYITITLKYILKNNNINSEFKVKYCIYVEKNHYYVQYFDLYDII